MWFSRRKFGLALTVGLGLSACGYQPAFGPSGAAQGLRNQVVLRAPVTRNEFDLAWQFERRLGHADTPVFQLNYELSVSQDGVGVTPQQEIIRNNVVGRLTYSLTDMASGAVLTGGSVDNFTGFSVDSVDVSVSPPSTNATISTLSAQRDAERRLMVILADQVVTQLIATAPGWAQ